MAASPSRHQPDLDSASQFLYSCLISTTDILSLRWGRDPSRACKLGCKNVSRRAASSEIVSSVSPQYCSFQSSSSVSISRPIDKKGARRRLDRNSDIIRDAEGWEM